MRSSILSASSRARCACTVLVVLLVAACAATFSTAWAQTAQSISGITRRVSVASDGTQSNLSSANSAISEDGSIVAFESSATNLVSGDTNSAPDIFVHDRHTGETTRISVSTGGAQADSTSFTPSISADGRYVAFASDASNLVSGDTNGCRDIFVHDRETGETVRVSVATDGTEGDDVSQAPAISADGQIVAFESYASTLVSGDTNALIDIFVHDRQSGETDRVSVSSGGTQGDGHSESPALSADGLVVAFHSTAGTLVSGDTGGIQDVFVHDLPTGETMRVSVATGGAQGNGNSGYPAISEDGTVVAFQSYATNLVTGDYNGIQDIFVHDSQSGQTQRVSVATGGAEVLDWSWFPSISADGLTVAFVSWATTLVNDDTNNKMDAFVHDRQSGETVRVSVGSGGAQANGSSTKAAISADGRSVAFESAASNLVGGDTNSTTDIFVYGPLEVIDNSGMETDANADKVPDGWKIKSPSGKSKLKCDNPIKNKYYSHSPTCAVVLASAGAKEVLQQTYTPITGAAGDAFTLSLWASGKSIPSNATARAVVQFAYVDGTKEKLILNLPTGDYAYQQLMLDVTAAQDYTSIKVKIEYAASGGKLSIDDVSLGQTN